MRGGGLMQGGEVKDSGLLWILWSLLPPLLLLIFHFLGSLVLSLYLSLYVCVYILLRLPPCVVPPVLFSSFLCSSIGFLSFLLLPSFLLCFGPLLWFSSRELRFWCSCCWRWRPGLLGVLDRRKEAYCCGCGLRLLKTTPNTQEMNRQLLFALLKEDR